jgi:hypothetical protein
MPRPQMLIFCYHKSGTVLMRNIVAAIAPLLGLTIAARYGMVTGIGPAIDVVVVGHSLLGFELRRSFRAIRIVRDPRDIWVSGYLYHRQCDEPWCVNTDLDPSPPITFPRVPHQREHRRERWKRDYLAGLGGKSYQANLLERDRDGGLEFELERYTSFTMEDMRAWQLNSPDLLEVKLETIARDFDATMRTIFHHLGFTEAEMPVVMEAAAREDIRRMDDAAIAANPHIHSREISKWRGILSPGQVRRFEQRYGDLIVRLGYELSNQGSSIG